MLAYVGDHPFIFFSYCHINKSQITQIADTLDKDGYRIWYDKSLEAGSAFDDVIAEHISASSVFVLFLSNNYLEHGTEIRHGKGLYLHRRSSGARGFSEKSRDAACLTERPSDTQVPHGGGTVFPAALQRSGVPDLPVCRRRTAQ